MTPEEMQNPGELDIPELMTAHVVMHSYFEAIKNDRTVEGWDLETVIENHEEIYDEIVARGLSHHELGSELDDTLEQQVRRIEPKVKVVQKGFELSEPQKQAIRLVWQRVKDGDIDPVDIIPNSEDGSIIIRPARGPVASPDDMVDLEAWA